MELSARERSRCVLLSVIMSLITPYTGSTTVPLFLRLAVDSITCAQGLPDPWFPNQAKLKPGISLK